MANNKPDITQKIIWDSLPYFNNDLNINMMETISIQINNPKAKQLLKDLAKLNLITIKPQITLQSVLDKLRINSNDAPSLDEITAEVEQVRKERYAKKS